jgi:hypothetical protein
VPEKDFLSQPVGDDLNPMGVIDLPSLFHTLRFAMSDLFQDVITFAKEGVIAMSSRTENPQPDPPQTWQRKNFAPLSQTMSAEERAEKEANRDLTKPIEQLLCDVHDMAERGSPGGDLGGYPVQALLHAQKRMVGMMARVALSNEKLAAENDVLQRRLFWLSIAVAALTGAATIFGAIQAAGVIVAWLIESSMRNASWLAGSLGKTWRS